MLGAYVLEKEEGGGENRINEELMITAKGHGVVIQDARPKSRKKVSIYIPPG